ncbi:MAG: HK97-gp10 family putative phage morphogenesis protein [Acidobacteriota bacterium]
MRAKESLRASLGALALKVKGLEEEVQRAARNGVSKASDHLREASARRAPVDEGNLESSIQSGLDEDDEEIRGWVAVPMGSPAADYALAMHEGDYELGERSRAKQAGQSETVGRKFIERAMGEEREEVARIMADELGKAIP